MRTRLYIPVAFSLFLLISLDVYAANPSFQSFDPVYFSTNNNNIKPKPTIITNNQSDVTFSNVTLNGTTSGSLTNFGATLDGVQIYSQGFTNDADLYWLDFNRTNEFGQVLIYHSIVATNNARLTITNNLQWRLLSINVIASGATVRVLLPYPLPHLNTNGFTIYTTNSITNYSLFLTNGNEFRFTIQSNVTYSTLWSTFGQ